MNVYLNEADHRRREPPTVDVELSEDLLSAATGSGNAPDLNLFSQALDSEVQQAFDALPVSFRVVVWLADVEELSYEEIAEIVGCPLGTVASRLYRGHSLLRECLKEFARRKGLVEE